MDGIVFLIVLALATIIVLPIVAIVTANSRTSQLRAEMAELISRIYSLERRLENLARRIAAPAEPPRETAEAAVGLLLQRRRQASSRFCRGPRTLRLPLQSLFRSPRRRLLRRRLRHRSHRLNSRRLRQRQPAIHGLSKAASARGGSIASASWPCLSGGVVPELAFDNTGSAPWAGC